MAGSQDIKMEVKVGILTTIAEGIYSDTYMKIREAVSNSMDNNASHFAFSVYKSANGNNSLSLFDNGEGITRDRIEEIFKSVGYGLRRKDQQAKKFYSYFGLGLMSILQLGKKVTIITKPKDKDEINKIDIDSANLFSPDLEDKHFSDFDIKLYYSNEEERGSLSPFTRDILRELFIKLPGHYTEIIIENLNQHDFDTINNANFFNELRKILPLEISPNEPLLNSLKIQDKNNIVKLLSDKELCPTINFHYRNANNGYKQLYKYFPIFKYQFTENNYDFKAIKEDEFIGYFITGEKDLGIINSESELEKDVEKRETGFWIRNKNFLVKESCYLDYPNLPKLITRKPIKNWIYGEIFHKNMNDFLEPSRKEFIINNNDFKSFRNKIKDILGPIIQSLEKSYLIGEDIVSKIVEPFENITDSSKKDNIIKNLEENIAKIYGHNVSEIKGDKLGPIMEVLEKISNDSLNHSNEFVNKIKEKKLIISEENYDLFVDPKGSEKINKYNFAEEKVDVILPSSTFKSQFITFFGKTFEIKFVLEKDIDCGVSFNDSIIIVNIAYNELKNNSISFLEVAIAAEYAYLSLGNDCIKNTGHNYCLDIMKKNILKFLSNKYIKYTESPLSTIVDKLYDSFS
jgi:hypothetical protein